MRKLTLFFALALTVSFANAQDKLYHNTFNLNQVELLDGPFKHAMDLNVKVLLEYDTDRLLAPFLHEAGLPKKAEYFPNWAGLDGHVGGHYVSALAIHYAATGNKECYDRLVYMIDELERCQIANGDGYIGGVPNSKQLWGNLKKGDFGLFRGAWVPWYNVHKMYAGLRDAWQYAGIEKAKDMFIKFCDWGLDEIAGLDDNQMEQMTGTEFGGMNEIFADAFQITGDRKYIEAAKRFRHKDIFENMADGRDNLDNKHANTQVPKAVGYARVAALDNDARARKAAEFFWDRVANHRSVVIGGNSRSEHFPAATDYKSYVENREGPESCNTNNMLKLTEFLFAIDPKAEYADFYEKAMYNHILSTQHPEHGGYVYFTPMRPAHYRVYSAVNQGMWCCVGTGMENHGKYGEFIYTHDGAQTLWVNLFVASKLNWTDNKAVITQETQFPYSESSKLTVNLKKARKFRLMVRCPEWVASGYSVKVNGKEYAADAQPSSYVAIERKWKNGDVVEISLPMNTTIEALDNEPEYLAVKHGPIVLAARTGTEGMSGLIADDGRWSHIAHGPLVPVTETPIMIGTRAQLDQKVAALKPVPGKPLHYTASGLFDSSRFPNVELEPFYSLHDSRYAIYFLSLSQSDYKQMLDKIKADEAAMLELDRRTVDAIVPGEQQPEADHKIQSQNSMTGNQDNKPYRTIRRNGSFSYDLYTEGNTNLSLCIGYWGAENNQNRAIEILIEDMPFITETEFPANGEAGIVRKEYDVPVGFYLGKEKIRVTFRSVEGKQAPRIFDIRFLK